MANVGKVVDPRFARDRGGYKDVINQIAGEAKCPFCPDNFKYHKNPILKRLGRWFITRSTWPYENTQYHFLIMSTAHHEELRELTDSDWLAVLKLAQYAVKKFKLPGGGLAMRFGETTYTGATVCHLHAHLIVPELNEKKGVAKTVWFPVG